MILRSMSKMSRDKWIKQADVYSDLQNARRSFFLYAGRGGSPEKSETQGTAPPEGFFFWRVKFIN